MIVVETWMDRDLDLGIGDTTKTHQSGGTISGHKINLTTFSTKGKGGEADTAAWAPGAVASAGKKEVDVTVQGAALGDMAWASYNKDLQGCGFSAYVSAENTVTVVINNNTGGSKTIASGTLKVLVFKVA